MDACKVHVAYTLEPNKGSDFRDPGFVRDLDFLAWSLAADGSRKPIALSQAPLLLKHDPRVVLAGEGPCKEPERIPPPGLPLLPGA